jgi:hypothetical protein
METYHWHHIVPRHAGGTDDPSNLVKVNKAMHAFMHRLRYQETGDLFDCAAANLLSGDCSADEARKFSAAEGIRRSEKHKKSSAQNWRDYNATEAAKESQKKGSKAQSLEDKAKGGRIGGKMPFWNNGLNNKRSHTCPGEGYVLGKLPVGKINRTYKQCPHCELTISSNNLTRHILAKHT